MNYQAFESFLILGSRHPTTIKSHILKLKVLERELTTWDVAGVGKFLLGLKKKGLSNDTLNHYIGTVRVYAQFSGIDELKSYKLLKRIQSSKTVLMLEDIEKILNMPCPPNSHKNQWEKDTIFLKLLATCVIRPGELARIRKQNILGEHIRIEKTKTGGGYRLILLHEAIHDEFFQYIKDIKDEYLFTTSRGLPYNDDSWGHMFKKRMKLAELDKVYPSATIYSLRHSGIREYLKKKIPAVTIAKMAGTSVEMVYNVYSHMVTEDVDEAIREHPFVAREIEKKRESADVLEGLKKIIREYTSKHPDKLSVSIEENEGVYKLHVKTKLFIAKH